MSKHSKTLEEINKYCEPTSLLIINHTGKIIRIFCPFQVIVIRNVHVLLEGEFKSVEAVKLSNDLMMLYVIHKVAYPYFFFIITLQEI